MALAVVWASPAAAVNTQGAGQPCDPQGPPCPASLACIDGYCCDPGCGQHPCSICNGADMHIPNAENGMCTSAPPFFEGRPACETTRCDGQGFDCPKECVTSSFCAPGYYCGTDSPDGGATSSRCIPQKNLGEPCPADCPKDQPCDACAGGAYCVDGVCCDTVCDGDCQACKGELIDPKSPPADGHCQNVAASQPGRGRCPGQPANTCGYIGVCDGKGACAISGGGVSCGVPACARDGSEGGLCDGGMPQASRDADSPQPDGEPARSSEEDGAASAGEGAPPVTPVCSDDFTQARGADGSVDDCAPYVCRDGACLRACERPGDCVAPNVCDFDGVCGPFHPVDPAADCAVVEPGGRPRGASSSRPLVMLAALACALAAALRRGARPRAR